MTDISSVSWTDASGQPQLARWRSEAGVPAPTKWTLADDTLNANTAYRLVCEGTALIWQGDFQNARQLLQALARRVDRKPRKLKAPATQLAEAFHQHRQGQAQRARLLGMLLVPVAADRSVPLRRAPDVRQALAEVWGPADAQPSLVTLRELQGLVGAHEWRKKGVEIPALGKGPNNRIHPHYGVFSPVRGEYVDLVRQAPWPAAMAGDAVAFDIGVGTGVLSALLARRGARQVLATDQDPRALACAEANLRQLGVANAVRLLQQDLFPGGQAALVLCNPPWLPARPSSPIEHAVYDPDSRMLRGFLAGLASHLMAQGEGWLILSDLAEHLGLRTREQLMGWIQEAGLQVLGRLDARPQHPKASDANDPLHRARAAEVTSLWRLGHASPSGV
ncbi:class I SAM-dependent methyltransferase [Curvibacter sp. HBC28]|uniref:Class I SAM-dependent methyltransferase n=1 Tax=Curvibacter microcysteis TaxID=3026419 RepID=A0ABT5MDP7_9BURK|nr:class I SAM-dependent methyltransferase [Curvibacter sp. HBC28]MDD0814704.1 class I SAM-dependent methyltransferase [Curvibacter sp. HBC28]